jgi:hypothetical protein
MLSDCLFEDWLSYCLSMLRCVNKREKALGFGCDKNSCVNIVSIDSTREMVSTNTIYNLARWTGVVMMCTISHCILQGCSDAHGQPVRLAYKPPASSTFLSEQTSHQQSASSTFLSEQTSHQQSANSTFLSEQTSTSHEPPAKRTGPRCLASIYSEVSYLKIVLIFRGKLQKLSTPI